MNKLEIHISRRLRDAALCTLFFMLILHGYRYVSLGFSHDSLAFAWPDDLTWQLSLGRFMQPVYWAFRGSVGAPFLVGLLTCVYMTLSVYGTASLLKVRSRLDAVPVGGADVRQSGTHLCGCHVCLSDGYLRAGAAAERIGGVALPAGEKAPDQRMSARRCC